MEYLFCSNQLYPYHDWPKALALKKSYLEVKPDTLLCYNVEVQDKSTWTFKVYGYGDIVFVTHYAWALVENTPSNVEAFTKWRAQQQVVEEAQALAESLHKKVVMAPGIVEVIPNG